jgi:hypothetical protein
VYYPDTGDSLSTGVAGGSGTFTLASRGDTLGGCFTAVLSDGTSFTEVLEGELLAVEGNPGTP